MTHAFGASKLGVGAKMIIVLSMENFGWMIAMMIFRQALLHVQFSRPTGNHYRRPHDPRRCH